MFKSVLVPLSGFESDMSALETAYRMARAFDGHIDCLLVRPNTREITARAALYVVGLPVVTPELVQSLEEEERTRAAVARQTFERLCKDHDIATVVAPPGPENVTAAWHEVEGGQIEAIVHRARLSDIIVVGHAPYWSALSPDAIGSILMACGRPVMLVPAKPAKSFARTIAVAWKDSAEAARALSIGMPLLRKAEKIVIIAASEGGDAAKTIEAADKVSRYLEWHKLEPETRCVVPGKQSAVESVVSAAEGVGADLLLMGGYGHSRLRELVFGGFTRHVLNGANLPVMLVH